MIEPEPTKVYEGADAHIYKETFYPESFVVENTIVPALDSCPDAVVAYGAGRSGSTGLWALMASQPDVKAAFYQPWKTLLRHGLKYGSFAIPEADGPFNKSEELDPVDLLVQAGYPLEKIKLIPLFRDPLDTFKSNLKFSGGIASEILISNMLFTWELYEKYNGKIPVIPLAYDLCDFGADVVMGKLFDKLEIPLQSLKFNQTAFRPLDQGGKVSFGEAAEPDEFAEIIAPTIQRGAYGYVNGGTIAVESFVNLVDMPGASHLSEDELIDEAEKIYEYNQLYEDFYALSATCLGIEI